MVREQRFTIQIFAFHLSQFQNFLLCKRHVDLGEHRTVYAFGNQPTSDPGVQVHDAHKHFADNVVVTSKVSPKICTFLVLGPI